LFALLWRRWTGGDQPRACTTPRKDDHQDAPDRIHANRDVTLLSRHIGTYRNGAVS
jgi:hypothetical protein